MKQISLILLVAVVVVACQPDLPPLPSEKAATSGSTAATGKTTATTPGATTTGTTAGTATTASTTTTGSTTTATGGTTSDQKPKPGDIVKRIFQLRELEKVTITGGRQPIEAFVADDDIKTKEGLMWVTDKDLKDTQGMVFVMPSAAIQSFWMQNTLIPLDIIYLDAEGKVVNIVHGKPKDESPLPSTSMALYVLELKDGMAAKLGIAPKTKLILPKTLKYRGDQQQQPGISFGQ
jgi:uncharacterized membrane protein (UPF0127 family)